MKLLATLGDFYHQQDLAEKALEHAVQLLREDGVTVELEYCSREELIGMLETKPDLVVLFAENRINPEDEVVKTWMDEKGAEAIVRYVENGGGWMAWHAGMASYENIKPYVSMLRGYFEYHPKEHQVVTYTSDPGSRFNELNETFAFIDEHYFVHCQEADTEVFMRSESVDGKSIAGWAHVYGAGRVMCVTPAHREEGLLDQQFQQVVVKTMKWTAKVD